MTKSEAEAMVAKHGSIRAAARATGTDRKSIAAALRKPSTDGASCKKGRTLAEFRATYDKSFIVPGKVKAALKALGNGCWEYEVAFAKDAGVALSDLGNFRDQFADYIVTVKDNRRVWAGSVSTAKTLREML